MAKHRKKGSGRSERVGLTALELFDLIPDEEPRNAGLRCVAGVVSLDAVTVRARMCTRQDRGNHRSTFVVIAVSTSTSKQGASCKERV